MATSLVPSTIDTSPARRQENETRLLNLLEAYAFAFKERIKREEPAAQWTGTVSTTPQSPTWVSDTLTPEFGLYTAAEEKRKKELSALDVFLAVAPRHMRELATAMGDNGAEAFRIMTDHLKGVVKHHEARLADTEKIGQRIGELEALMQPGASLPELPQTYASQQEQVTAMLDVMRRTNQTFVELAQHFAARDEGRGRSVSAS